MGNIFNIFNYLNNFAVFIFYRKVGLVKYNPSFANISADLRNLTGRAFLKCLFCQTVITDGITLVVLIKTFSTDNL